MHCIHRGVVYLSIIDQYALPSTAFIMANANIWRLSRQRTHRIHLYEGTQFSEYEGREGPRHNSRKFQQFLWNVQGYGQQRQATLLLPGYQQLRPTSATLVFTFPRLTHFLPFLTYFVYIRIQTITIISWLYQLIPNYVEVFSELTLCKVQICYK